jgi:hypothetical protein
MGNNLMGDIMSKFLLIASMFVFTSVTTVASAQSLETNYVLAPKARVLFTVLEVFKVQKFIETTETINVRVDRVNAIRVSASRNDVEIIEARALLENGNEVYMDRLTGELGEDRSKTHVFPAIRGRRVERIVIRATSRQLIGSRGELAVSVGVIR